MIGPIRTMTLVLVGVLSVSFSIAHAGDGSPGQKPRKGKLAGNSDRGAAVEKMLERFDSDGDGSVAIADLPAPLQQRLQSLDKNGDGNLTRDELPTGKPGSFKAGATRPGSGMSKMFEHLDADGNGKLEGDEIPPRMKQNLARIDKNGDGVVEKSEIEAMGGRGPGAPGDAGPDRAAMMLQRLKEFDSDGDGNINIDELPEPARQMVGRADSNGDGILSKDELAEMSKRLSMRSGGPGEAGPMMNPEALFKNFDGNNDGKLSKDELAAIPRLPIDKLDANGDGELTKEEFRSRVQMLRRPMDRGERPGGNDAGSRPRQMFLEQDADADGRITKSEAKGILADRFTALDVDGNGQLDVDEVVNGTSESNRGTKKTNK